MNCNTEVFEVVKFFNEEISPYAAHFSEKCGCNYINVHNEGKGISEEQIAAANKKMAGTGAIISRFGGTLYIKFDKAWTWASHCREFEAAAVRPYSNFSQPV